MSEQNPMASTDEFVYLLNAMESAAASRKPFEHGYAEKRKAVLAYVQSLRSQLGAAEAEKKDGEKVLRFLREGGRVYPSKCNRRWFVAVTGNGTDACETDAVTAILSAVFEDESESSPPPAEGR